MEVSIGTVMGFGMMPSRYFKNPFRNTLVLCADVLVQFWPPCASWLRLIVWEDVTEYSAFMLWTKLWVFFFRVLATCAFESKRLEYFRKSSVTITQQPWSILFSVSFSHQVGVLGMCLASMYFDTLNDGQKLSCLMIFMLLATLFQTLGGACRIRLCEDFGCICNYLNISWLMFISHEVTCL